jgi:hypothetical protein
VVIYVGEGAVGSFGTARAELASDNRGRLKRNRETDRQVLQSRLTSIGVL